MSTESKEWNISEALEWSNRLEDVVKMHDGNCKSLRKHIMECKKGMQQITKDMELAEGFYYVVHLCEQEVNREYQVLSYSMVNLLDKVPELFEQNYFF